jgi:hypothetical protein
MTLPTATITGRVVGPDGLGRVGRITFTTAGLGAPPLARDVIAGRTSIRIDTDGYLVGPTGRSVTLSPGNYEIDLNIPGDSGVHIRRRVALSEGRAFTLAGLLSGTYTPPPPQPPPRPPEDGILTPGGHEVRHADGSDALEAVNSAEVIDLGDGVLTWRRIDDGLIRPDGRGARILGTPDILEAMDKAAVIDLGNGALTWR